jgi:hypothetical protein
MPKDKLILFTMVANSEWCYPHREIKGVPKGTPYFYAYVVAEP